MNLYCIQVCDTAEAYAWTSNIDPQQYYSANCNSSSLNDVLYANKKLISIKDIYGRDSSKKTNSLLFFLYQDGTVQKQIILD